MRLTDEGTRFFRICADAMREIDVARDLIAQAQAVPSGLLRVSAPNALGLHVLPAFLASFVAKYPDIKVHLNLTNRFVDLVSEGVDVAIRAGVLKDSSLVAKRIGTSYLTLYAAPSYVKRFGEPKDPQDLSAHRCLDFAPLGGDWKLSSARRSVKVRIVPHLVVDDLTALKELAVQGAGIGLFSSFVAEESVKRKQLVRVLNGWKAQPTHVYLLYPAQKHPQPKLRVFVDEAAAALQSVFAADR
jgi:DNA-binding transcriptional LysR family regulator